MELTYRYPCFYCCFIWDLDWYLTHWWLNDNNGLSWQQYLFEDFVLICILFKHCLLYRDWCFLWVSAEVIVQNTWTGMDLRVCFRTWEFLMASVAETRMYNMSTNMIILLINTPIWHAVGAVSGTSLSILLDFMIIHNYLDSWQEEFH